MRLDRLLPLAAAALLAACNPQSAERSGGAARAPLPAIQAPTAKTAAAECPCPTADKAKAPGAARKAVAHKASHRVGAHRAAARKAVAHAERRSYRRYEALAGGPPAARSEYARVPREYYEDGAATTYRYGPAYPSPPTYRDREDELRDEYRYERGDAGRHHDYEDRYEERRGPPPPQPKRSERGSSYESGSSHSERYSYRDDEARRLPPPPRGYGYQERRTYEGRYEERSESSSTFEHHGVRREGPCCRTEAAGFDANGFLTWPGKVPARP